MSEREAQSDEMAAMADLWRQMALLRPERPLEEQRELLEAGVALMELPEGVTVTPVDAGGVPAELVTPAGAGTEDGLATGAAPRLVLFHSGGYCVGSAATHRQLAGRLAAAAALPVLVVDYRLAPEHPYPAALEDALAALRWQQAEMPGAPVGLVGDSAGGGLAVAAMAALRQAGEPLPAACVVASPWVDLRCTAPAVEGRADRDPVLTPGWLRSAAAHYLAGTDPAEPGASPLLGRLDGLPPVLVQGGTDDLTHDDATGLFERLVAAGGEAELEIVPGAIHDWVAVAPDTPEARAALAHAVAFLRSRLAV